jgi:HAE1 family hydrophobic/amphiphilic exporter-1
MLASAIVGVLVIPMLYVVFQWMREKTGWRPPADRQALPADEPHAAAPAETPAK